MNDNVSEDEIQDGLPRLRLRQRQTTRGMCTLLPTGSVSLNNYRSRELNEAISSFAGQNDIAGGRCFQPNKILSYLMPLRALDKLN
jgi:hypothetical protein